jgi:hypothetical protein
MRRPRFSLRSLLIVTAILAAICYWRERPRQMANRFVAAIEAGEYYLAESMCGDEPLALSERLVNLGGWEAARKPQTMTDWLLGRCYVHVGGRMKYTDDDGTFQIYSSYRPLVARAAGVYPLRDWSSLPNNVAPLLWPPADSEGAD